MESRFTIFFLLTRSLLLLIPGSLFCIPFYILFGNFKGYEKEPTVTPALICAAIVFPLAWLTIRNFIFIRIKLTEADIEIISVLRKSKVIYTYSEVEKIDLKAYKIEGATRGPYAGGWGSNQRDINYEEQVTVCFKDGYEFIIAADVYSNYNQLYEFIKSRKIALHQE